MITLYHGSNVVIDVVDLKRSKKGKDFGQGFYLNPNKKQAYDMALRTVQRMSCGRPVVNIFTFNDAVLYAKNDLWIKVFEDYSEEWAEFVLMNRRNKSDVQAHNYDIVIGPIADDTVGVQIRRYTLGYISMEKLVEELKYKGSHAIQFFFGTEKSIKLLIKQSHG